MNPVASARFVNLLIEGSERKYCMPDEAMRDELERAREELEDRLEGVTMEVAA